MGGNKGFLKDVVTEVTEMTGFPDSTRETHTLNIIINI